MIDPIIKSTLGEDRVAEYFGMRTESAGEGHATVSLLLEDRHLNGLNIAQGGVIFALADVAFALASNSRGAAIAANCTISFCSATKAGTLRAVAREISLSRKLGTYEVTVSGDDGKVVALFQGLAYRKAE